VPRLPVVLTAIAVAVVIGVGAWVAVDRKPSAFRVGSTEVSQSTVNDELSVIHDNTALASSIAQQQVAGFTEGAVPSNVATAWLTIRIQTTLARNVLTSLHGRITAADRSSVGLPTTGAYAHLPADFRHDLIETLAAVPAAARTLTAKDPQIVQRALDACASKRFVSHILVQTEAEATALKAQLDGGADFATVARKSSGDTTSAAAGGSLGCLDDLTNLVPEFLSVAKAQPIDVVSDPVQTQFGFHLILVRAQPSADDVKAAAIAQLVRRLRSTEVSVNPRYGEWDHRRSAVVAPATSSG